MQKYQYICEVCGKTSVMTQDEAYQDGWDYPPFMGTYGVISPRTCPNCSMMDTAWAALTLKKIPYEKLSEKQKNAIERIKGEPDNMIV